MRNAPGAQGWLGDLFNANFGVPEGWFFWKGQLSEGVAGKGIVSITDQYSYSGRYSLRVSDDASNTDEVVAISDRNLVQPNTEYLVTARVKRVGTVLNPPPRDVEKAIFFTVTYHRNSPTGWDETRGEDFFVIDQTVTDRDWTLYSFTLTTPAEANRLSIRGRMQHQATGQVYFDDFAVVEGQVTRVKDGGSVPLAYALSQNYPNPFNPETRISYSLPKNAHVTIEIYNTLGQKVRRLVDENKAAGNYDVLWDGRNDAGNVVATGVYFYQLRTDDAKLTRRMLLLAPRSAPPPASMAATSFSRCRRGFTRSGRP
jgi:hypothetical protein